MKKIWNHLFCLGYLSTADHIWKNLSKHLLNKGINAQFYWLFWIFHHFIGSIAMCFYLVILLITLISFPNAYITPCNFNLSKWQLLSCIKYITTDYLLCSFAGQWLGLWSLLCLPHITYFSHDRVHFYKSIVINENFLLFKIVLFSFTWT